MIDYERSKKKKGGWGGGVVSKRDNGTWPMGTFDKLKVKRENCLVRLQAPQYKGGTSCNRILTSWGPW